MKDIISTWERRCFDGKGIDKEDAFIVLSMPDDWLFDLLGATWRIRKRWKGDNISLCSIINAKSGQCSEDCSFCAQSRISKADIKIYPLMDPEEIYRSAIDAMAAGAVRFSIVTSGKGIKGEKEINILSKAIEAISNLGLEPCASIGIVDEKTLSFLKNHGLKRFHHNLETSRSYFTNVCTTHSYDEDIMVLKKAKDIGLKICCGGIFGLGESDDHRVELAMTIRDLEVDSIPINFLHPIKGTKLEGLDKLSPLECIRIISMMRLTNPTKDIIICGGREVNLRDLQNLIFPAGANGLMIGNYLTTPGRSPEEDLIMLRDLCLKGT